MMFVVTVSRVDEDHHWIGRDRQTITIQHEAVQKQKEWTMINCSPEILHALVRHHQKYKSQTRLLEWFVSPYNSMAEIGDFLILNGDSRSHPFSACCILVASSSPEKAMGQCFSQRVHAGIWMNTVTRKGYNYKSYIIIYVESSMLRQVFLSGAAWSDMINANMITCQKL